MLFCFVNNNKILGGKLMLKKIILFSISLVIISLFSFSEPFENLHFTENVININNPVLELIFNPFDEEINWDFNFYNAHWEPISFSSYDCVIEDFENNKIIFELDNLFANGSCYLGFYVFELTYQVDLDDPESIKRQTLLFQVLNTEYYITDCYMVNSAILVDNNNVCQEDLSFSIDLQAICNFMIDEHDFSDIYSFDVIEIEDNFYYPPFSLLNVSLIGNNGDTITPLFSTSLSEENSEDNFVWNSKLVDLYQENDSLAVFNNLQVNLETKNLELISTEYELLIESRLCDINVVQYDNGDANGYCISPNYPMYSGGSYKSFILPTQTITNIESINPDFKISVYPNPFNPRTTISFNVKENNEKIDLAIYNVKGEKIKSFSRNYEKGEQSFVWNGKDMKDKPVASGIYFVKISSFDSEIMEKMLLIK